jgi:hypothetical protein
MLIEATLDEEFFVATVSVPVFSAFDSNVWMCLLASAMMSNDSSNPKTEGLGFPCLELPQKATLSWDPVTSELRELVFCKFTIHV